VCEWVGAVTATQDTGGSARAGAERVWTVRESENNAAAQK
jgi:hypothetical protein